MALDMAASLTGLATAGIKLSAVLYDYCRSVSQADANASNIAREVELTSNTLKSVGNVFQQHDIEGSVSPGAIDDVRGFIHQCESIFQEVQQLTNRTTRRQLDGRPRLPTLHKFLWPITREPQIELLQRRLESLKTNLTLMLEVLSFASGTANRKLMEATMRMECERIRDLHFRSKSQQSAIDALQERISEMEFSRTQIDIGLEIPPIMSEQPSNSNCSSISASSIAVDSFKPSPLKRKPISRSSTSIEQLDADTSDSSKINELEVCLWKADTLACQVATIERTLFGKEQNDESALLHQALPQAMISPPPVTQIPQQTLRPEDTDLELGPPPPLPPPRGFLDAQNVRWDNRPPRAIFSGVLGGPGSPGTMHGVQMRRPVKRMVQFSGRSKMHTTKFASWDPTFCVVDELLARWIIRT
ncbi:hypothetical protein NA57DRAFT_59055 [Rhizodiscina lignyota]|uniref:Fungal N-terminal domain-containing protein n=1 Tax=Rhizodiscina lignyota TaxID=1504668 RepID=A0A9P4M3R0_9PEZI|nr:hypothetical protein NA57DRAFT_59055 [Rhizodiscina lignyota]